MNLKIIFSEIHRKLFLSEEVSSSTLTYHNSEIRKIHIQYDYSDKYTCRVIGEDQDVILFCELLISFLDRNILG